MGKSNRVERAWLWDWEVQRRSCTHLRHRELACRSDDRSHSWGKTKVMSTPHLLTIAPSHREPSLCSIKERNPITVPQVLPTDYSFTSQGQSQKQWRKAVRSLQMDLVWTGRTPWADWANLTHAATSNYLHDKKAYLQKTISPLEFRSVFPYLSPQNVPRIWIPITLTI